MVFPLSNQGEGPADALFPQFFAGSSPARRSFFSQIVLNIIRLPDLSHLESS
jgi:hypothetical protein